MCRDSTRLLPCGKYSGGKVFCACAGAHALAAHAGRLRRHGRHLYEHVGHDVEHPLAPYLDVELLLTLDNDEKAYAPLIRCYVDAVAEILRPHVALDPGENMRIGTAIARVPVHRNAQGALRKGAPSSPSSQGAGQALLLSFHLKVHAPGAYFRGSAQQAHFWRTHAGALAARVAPAVRPHLADPEAFRKMKDDFGAGWFDHLVYNERPWRLLYNSKISDSSRVLVPWPPRGDHSDTWDAALMIEHMVTQVDTTVPSLLPSPPLHSVVGHAGTSLAARVGATMSPAFRRLLLPHRLMHDVTHKQQRATHYWPPNGPALYFAVPPARWEAIEALLWEAEGSASPPLLAYCYAQRRHALQLDIDKSPVQLRDVALACHAALVSAGALADPGALMAVEESPPKADRPGLVHGRLTFPAAVVDEDLSTLLKLACAQACYEKWPHVPLSAWAVDIIDPQSRGARTHHSAKEGAPGRVSKAVGVWDGRGCPQSGRDDTHRGAFLPAARGRRPPVALSAPQRARPGGGARRGGAVRAPL